MHQSVKKPCVRVTHAIDANGKVLGRLATHIATLLRGKHKPTFEPHIDAGDIVVVSNVSQIKLSGQKRSQKVYHHYSGYPGGLKTQKMAPLMDARPEEVLRRAVYQMLPPTRLRPHMMKRLVITK